MNHSINRLVRAKGPVRVTWVCLSEGYNGEYDPTNPEDELLLRFNLFLKDKTSGEWKFAESRRTCFAAKASVKDKKAALDILLDCFYTAYTSDPRQSLSSLADTLSYISADTYHSLSFGADHAPRKHKNLVAATSTHFRPTALTLIGKINARKETCL